MAKHYRLNAEPGIINASGTPLGKPKAPEQLIVPATKQIKIGRDKDMVVVEVDGKALKLRFDVAAQVAQAMVRVARGIHQEVQLGKQIMGG